MYRKGKNLSISIIVCCAGVLIVMTLLFVKENDFFVEKKSIKQKGLTSSCQVYCNVTELLVFVDLPLVK